MTTVLEKNNPLISGIILAGGRGSRMGGQDKGWLSFAGKPLIQHVIERLSPQVSEIVIVANRHQSDYTRFGFTVVEDQIGGFQGPLAGIHSGLSAIRNAVGLVVPTDAPLIPFDLAERLLKACNNPENIAHPLLCHDGKRQQPLFGLYPASAGPSIESFLKNGERKLMRWCEENNAEWIDLSDCADGFANLNTPDDLAQAERY